MKLPATSRVAALLVSLLLCSRAVQSSAVQGVDTLCLETCQQCLPAKHFHDADDAASAAARVCGSRLALESTYLCMRVYCGDPATTAALATLKGSCPEGLPGLEIIANYTEKDIERVKRVSFGDDLGEGWATEVLLPTEAFFSLWWRTLDSWEYATEWHYISGVVVSVFWGVVVTLAVLVRLIAATSILLPKDWIKPFKGVSSWALRNFLVPASFGHRRAQRVWWCTIPQRSQTVTIAAFFVLQVYLCVAGYRVFPGNVYYPSVTDQVLRQVSDRTGIISFALFPLLWLFGMRNNLLIWLTGWDFGAWSNFHRWVARGATVQAVVHSIGYTVLIVRSGGWEYYAFWWTQMFWWTGQIATIAMSLLLGLSVYWLRRYQYEMFLIVHIALSAVVLVTMLGHVSIFKGQYDLLFWIPAMIWAFDRLLRLGRIFCFNVLPWTTKAIAVYDKSANIVRLKIPCETSVYQPRPGTYYYLMVLNDVRCWESHPFTLASVSHAQALAKDFEEDTPLLESNSSGVQCSPPDPEHTGYVSFLIRPYDSFTARLRHLAGSATLRVLVEGPYGSTWPLHRFDNVLFVVGGSGIVVALSYLRSLLSDSAKATFVQIHWAVRETQLVEDVIKKDIGDLLFSERLTVQVYTTSMVDQLENPDHAPSVRFHRRRLDVHALVGEATERAKGGNLAVVACGPARMADDTRQAAVSATGKTSCDVQYFEEDFQW